MSLTSTLRVLGLLSLATSALGACSEDKAKPIDRGQESDDDETEGEGDGEEDPNASLDAGMTPRMDAALPPGRLPPKDGGALPDGGVVVIPDLPAPDASIKPPDIDVPSILIPPLPNDGEQVAVCYSDLDCNGDDLTCVSSLGPAGAGYCNDDCATDLDCKPIDGVKAVCDILTQQCRLPCSGADAESDECPENMICRNVGTNVLFPVYQCTYPVGAGSKDVDPWAKCLTIHGSGDCEGLTTCRIPTMVTGDPPIGNGYCAPPCLEAKDCTVPEGVTSTAVCDTLGCELDCAGAGVTCPKGMNCIDINDTPALDQFRCRFVD